MPTQPQTQIFIGHSEVVVITLVLLRILIFMPSLESMFGAELAFICFQMSINAASVPEYFVQWIGRYFGSHRKLAEPSVSLPNLI